MQCSFGRGLVSLTPLWCLSTPQVCIEPPSEKIIKNKSKIHCWPPLVFHKSTASMIWEIDGCVYLEVYDLYPNDRPYIVARSIFWYSIGNYTNRRVQFCVIKLCESVMGDIVRCPIKLCEFDIRSFVYRSTPPKVAAATYHHLETILNLFTALFTCIIKLYTWS